MDVPLSVSLTASAKRSPCHSGHRTHLAEL